MVATTELTFLVIFAFWALVISEVPAINHTEKPMDFGILNAVANADRFPPEDQWLSGHSIAYYYGGHYAAAMLSTLTGVSDGQGVQPCRGHDSRPAGRRGTGPGVQRAAPGRSPGVSRPGGRNC